MNQVEQIPEDSHIRDAVWVIVNELAEGLIEKSAYNPMVDEIKQRLAGIVAKGVWSNGEGTIKRIREVSRSIRLDMFEVQAVLKTMLFLEWLTQPGNLQKLARRMAKEGRLNPNDELPG